MNEKLIRIRAVFALNEYEARIFLCLLEHGRSQVSWIAEVTKVPRSRIYDTAESLINKGFVKEFGSVREPDYKPRSYEILSFDKIAKNIRKDLTQIMDERVKAVERFGRTWKKRKEKEESN